MPSEQQSTGRAYLLPFFIIDCDINSTAKDDVEVLACVPLPEDGFVRSKRCKSHVLHSVEPTCQLIIVEDGVQANPNAQDTGKVVVCRRLSKCQ